MYDKGEEGLSEVLEILGEGRLRPNHEKARSTTQRRASATKPFTPSLRLMISRRNTGILATAASTLWAW